MKTFHTFLTPQSLNRLFRISVEAFKVFDNIRITETIVSMVTDNKHVSSEKKPILELLKCVIIQK